MEDRIFIQHRFQIIEGDLRYDDALIMPREGYELLSDSEIDKLKQQRFDNWKEVVANPPVAIEPSDEEKLEAVKVELEYLQTQKKELEAKIGGK
jgi:hypothetical protein